MKTLTRCICPLMSLVILTIPAYFGKNTRSQLKRGLRLIQPETVVYKDHASFQQKVQTEDLPDDWMSPSCVQSLLDSEKAIIASPTLGETSMKFSILLHPLSKDKYITAGVLRHGAYEHGIGQFITNALPITDNAASDKNSAIQRPWAVDVGANVGFHGLHMARRGANVIAFEPAPDTFELLQCSADLLGSVANSLTPSAGFVKVFQAGASDAESEGKMVRHPDSPGMTTFGNLEKIIGEDKAEKLSGDMIKLVRVENILVELGVPEGPSDLLRLLKVDAEGFELRAFRGINLERFPFQFLIYELFPTMLENAGSDPVDVLVLLRDAGYKCNSDELAGDTRETMNKWVSSFLPQNHMNVFCELKRT